MYCREYVVNTAAVQTHIRLWRVAESIPPARILLINAVDLRSYKRKLNGEKITVQQKDMQKYVLFRQAKQSESNLFYANNIFKTCLLKHELAECLKQLPNIWWKLSSPVLI